MKRKITIEQNRDDLDKYDVFEDDKPVGYIVRKSDDFLWYISPSNHWVNTQREHFTDAVIQFVSDHLSNRFNRLSFGSVFNSTEKLTHTAFYDGRFIGYISYRCFFKDTTGRIHHPGVKDWNTTKRWILNNLDILPTTTGIVAR